MLIWRSQSPFINASNIRQEIATEISSKQEGSVYKNEENLPVLLKTVERSSVTTLSYEGLSSNHNIFKGSIVKLGGVYYKIINIEGNTATIDGNCDTSQTSAEFVYAMIVDNNDNGSGLSSCFKRNPSPSLNAESKSGEMLDSIPFS